MILAPAPVAIGRFTWNSGDRTLSAEMSELTGFGRVYDDAVDEGLTVIGRSGREVTFVVAHVETDREGDVQYWLLVPAKANDHRLNVTVTVYND
jgi:hypothetical protein